MQTGILLTVAYDGSNYVGFQFQTNGLSIQEVLEKALTKIEKQFIRIKGASRTDSGVHASGQRIFYISDKTLPEVAYIKGMNALLPDDVSVVSVKYVNIDFNPRFSAGKLYEYRILNSKIPNPLDSRFHWQIFKKLNVQNMIESTKYLVGTHDFASFQAADCERENSIRTIYKIKIESSEPYISIFVSGSAFLKNMVRILVGTLVDVGNNRLTPLQVKQILEAKDRTKSGKTAPAKGLFLRKIIYKNEDQSILF